MTDNPEQIPVTSGSRNDSSNTHTNNRSGNSSRQTRLQRNLMDVNNSDRDFTGAVEELGVLGTVLEKYLKHYKSFDKFILALLNLTGRTYDHGADLKPAIMDLVDPLITLSKLIPMKPKKKEAVLGKVSNATLLSADELQEKNNELQQIYDAEKEAYEALYEAQLEVWKSDVKNFSRRKNLLASNLTKLYSLILGQCTQALIANIKKEKDYDDKSRASDALWLLRVLKRLCAGINTNHNPSLTRVRALKAYFNCIQGDTETSAEYNERQASCKRNVDTLCGPILRYIDMDDDALSELEVEEHMASAILLLNADRTRHAARLQEMEKAVELGDDRIPTEQHKAFEILVANEERLKREQLRYHRSARIGIGGVNLYQQAGRGVGGNGRSPRGHREWPVPEAERVIGRDGTLICFQCFHCNKWGHKQWNCPECDPGQGVSMGKYGKQSLNFMECDMSLITVDRYFIDTGASDSTTFTDKNATNLKRCLFKNYLYASTNAGDRIFKQKQDLKFLPLNVYYDPHSMANVLAAHEIEALDGYHIYHDGSVDEDYYVLNETENRVMRFVKCKEGLYYYDVSDPKTHELKLDDFKKGTCLMQTVQGNEAMMTRRELMKARKAREYQDIMGWPKTSVFRSYIENSDVDNIDITVDDIDRATFLWGEAKEVDRGQTTRPSSKPHETMAQDPLPKLHDKRVDLYIDVMMIRKREYLVCKGGRVNYTTSYPLENKTVDEVLKKVQVEMTKYKERGLKVVSVHVDNAFNTEKFHSGIGGSILVPYASNEHVGIVEREIRTLKERVRSKLAGMPYKKITDLMLDRLVVGLTKLKNRLPTGTDLTKRVSPASIVEGRRKLNFASKWVRFGAYCEVWTKTKNTTEWRTQPAIALDRANDQGAYYFMNTLTGRRLHSKKWVEKPITQEVIQRVEELAKLKIANHDAMIEMWSEIEACYAKYKDESGEENVETALDENEVRVMANNIAEDEEQVQEGDNNIQIEEGDINVPDDGHNLIEDESDTDVSGSIDKSGIDENILEIAQDIEDELDEGIDSNSDDEITVASVKETNWDRYMRENYVYDGDNLGDYIEDPSESSVENTDEGGIETSESSSDEQQQYHPSGRPRRNVRSNVDWRDQTGEFGDEGHQRLRGQQNFQRKIGNLFFQNKKGVSMFQNKYNVALNLMQKNEKNLKNVELLWTNSYLNKLKSAKPEQRDERLNGMLQKAVGVLFASMSFNKGLKKHGEVAVAKLFKELTQLDQGATPDKPVCVPQCPDILTVEDKKKALDAVVLLEEKRNGDTKVRSCANGSKQRMYLKEYESVASPTVSLEGLLMHLVIGAYEKRNFISFDVPGAFLQAKFDDDKMLLLKLRGDVIVDTMCEVNPDHKQNVRYEKGKKVLYMRVIRAIYGCIESALAWYTLFTETLERLGFNINPYDRCIANKIINGHQCTISWHVDDCLASHKEKKVLDDLALIMIREFGDMEISRGKDHSFLGMEIEVSDGIVKLSMKKQLNKLITDFEKEYGCLDNEVSSPGNRQLFNIKMDAEQLDEKRSKDFHSITAALLYLMKRVRPDIETAISFLMRRVSKSDVDDWWKLKRVLAYLKNSIDDVRVVGATSLTEILSWIDASFAVHSDMKSHTGGCTSMGIGLVHQKSSTQKSNSKSSCESEIIGVSEYLPYNLWFLMFLEAQGYGIGSNLIFQDNKSAILLARNGRNSCTGNSRHVAVRYFFIKDRVDKGEVRVEYLPTGLMLADFYTKPLQGRQFEFFKQYIMGWKPMSKLLVQHENCASIKEGVENRHK